MRRGFGFIPSDAQDLAGAPGCRRGVARGPGCTNKAFLYEIEIVLHSIRQKKSRRGEGCVQVGAPTLVSTPGPAHLSQPHVRGPCCLNAMHCCKQAWVSWGPTGVLLWGKKDPNPSGFGSRVFWTSGLSWGREVAGTEGAGALTHFKIALGLFLAGPAPPSSPAVPWGLGKQRPLVGTPTEGHLGSDGHKGALLTRGLGT